MIKMPAKRLLAIRKIFLPIAWFLFLYLFSEIYLHASIYKNADLFFPLILCVPAAIFAAFLCSRFSRMANILIGGVITLLVCAFCIMELIYYGIFHTMLAPFSSIEMAGNAVDFQNVLFGYIGKNIGSLSIALLPCILYPILCFFKGIGYRLPKKLIKKGWATAFFTYILGFICMLPFGSGLKSPLYTYFYSTQINYNIETLGLFTGISQDFGRMVLKRFTGIDTLFYKPLDNISIINRGEGPGDPNIVDYNFEKLIEHTDDSKIQSLHEYVANEDPTYKNIYTGMFEGYNLIFITAEGWWKYAVRVGLTPTLYKMLNEGFVFENYYTPLWYGSTIGGEFANLTGQIPKESGKFSMVETGENKNNMQFTLSRMLQKKGYGVRAFHSYLHDFYIRNLSHPNMGFEWYAGGNGGYQFETHEDGSILWPQSDLKLVSDTFNVYCDKTPFYTNYMSFSGHANYDETNDMSKRHWDLVKRLPYSDQAKSYLACNYELELAVEYLVQHLEEKGLLENTLFVIGPDHIPYGFPEMCSELAGQDLEDSLEWYHSSLIIWSASMQEPVNVSKYCSSIDIFPTVANLMGLEYDSRVLAGQDILSDAEQFVIFPDRSWITGKGIYESGTGEFQPFENMDGLFEDEEVLNEYIDNISGIVENKIQLSADIVDHDYYAYLPGVLYLD